MKIGKYPKPKSGWHWAYCFLCGKKISMVVHFGGKKKLKHCGYCQSLPHYCIKCFKYEK